MNLSFEFFSLKYRIFRSYCDFFAASIGRKLLDAAKKSQYDPESLCISLREKPKTQVMRTWTLFFLLIIATLSTEALYCKPVKFVIVSPSYNNEAWCQRSLESLACQTYLDWCLIYINDCSTDNTQALVESYINESILKNRSIIFNNKKRVGAMANLDKVIRLLPEDTVVVNLDGDDRLAHAEVLQRLAEEYADEDVWMTYGNYRGDPDGKLGICTPFPEEVTKHSLFRSYSWVSSHLKTYYAKLFQQIAKDDLMYNGEYLQVASDVAFMLPMLEMSSQGHIRYIPDILYLYNVHNPLSDVKNLAQYVTLVDRELRGRKKYRSLVSLFPLKKSK